jgi:hypothetical protein
LTYISWARIISIFCNEKIELIFGIVPDLPHYEDEFSSNESSSEDYLTEDCPPRSTKSAKDTSGLVES